MPALFAVRHNPDLARKYQAMIAAGKPTKLALTALSSKWQPRLSKQIGNSHQTALDPDGYSGRVLSIPSRSKRVLSIPLSRC